MKKKYSIKFDSIYLLKLGGELPRLQFQRIPNEINALELYFDPGSNIPGWNVFAVRRGLVTADYVW